MSSLPRTGIIISLMDPNLIKKIRGDNDDPSELYLCVHQNASKLWGFPKGRLKENETKEAGACRELKEETDVDLREDEINESDSIHIKRGKHHHFYYFKTLNYIPEVKIDQDEIDDYSWFSLDELSKHNISFFTEQVLRRIKPSLFYNKIESNFYCSTSLRGSNDYNLFSTLSVNNG